MTTQTHDLGAGWFANLSRAGVNGAIEALTLRNPDKGQRIDLDGPQVEMLRAVFVAASVSPERIADMMVGAIEGGSTYWCESINLVEPAKRVWTQKPWYAAPEVYECPDLLLNVTPIDEGTKTIGRDHFLRGLMLMAGKSPDHFADLVKETDDATTADVFLQYVALGDIVYG